MFVVLNSLYSSNVRITLHRQNVNISAIMSSFCRIINTTLLSFVDQNNNNNNNNTNNNNNNELILIVC